MNHRPKPYVAVATLCEKVLQEKDNVVSLVRIVDTVKFAVVPGQGAIRLTLMVMLRSGEAIGRYEVRFVMRKPSGEQQELAVAPTIELTGNEHGANIQADLLLRATEIGLHWFDVLVDGEKLTSVPLRLLLQEPEPTPPMSTS